MPGIVQGIPWLEAPVRVSTEPADQSPTKRGPAHFFGFNMQIIPLVKAMSIYFLIF